MKFIIISFFYCFLVSTHSQKCVESEYETSFTRATIGVIDEFLKETTGNAIFSPASITLLMGIVSLGAAGRTESQINNFFKFNKNCLKEELSNFVTSMLNEKGMNISNYAFIQKDFRIRQTFLDILRNDLQSTFKKFDFENKAPVVKEKINNIVANETNGLIKGFLKENLPTDTVIFLLNTVTFRGEWSQKFNNIGKQKFTKQNGRPVLVPTMQISSVETQYFDDDDVEVVSIPYDGIFNFVLVLPKKRKNLENISIISKINSFKTGRQTVSIEKLQMPKFKADKELNVKEILEKRDIEISHGNYSRINRNVKVSQILHRAVIEVDEEGTKAAGASGISIVPKFGGDLPEKEIIVDRPFAYIISDSTFSTAFFAGTVKDLP